MERIVDYDQQSCADDGREEDEKELKTDPQTQAKASHVFLGELMSQVGHAQTMFLFEVPVLRVEELRLLLQERRCIARYFRIAARKLGRHRRGKGLRAREGLRSLNFRLLLLAAEHSAEHPFSHAIPALLILGILVHVPRLGNIRPLRAQQQEFSARRPAYRVSARRGRLSRLYFGVIVATIFAHSVATPEHFSWVYSDSCLAISSLIASHPSCTKADWSGPLSNTRIFARIALAICSAL